MIKDIYESASNLFDGWWRKEDKEELIKEYELEEDDADKICEALEQIEKNNKDDWHLGNMRL